MVFKKKAAPVELDDGGGIPEIEPIISPVPQYSPEGILLNPQDFSVTQEGLLIPKEI